MVDGGSTETPITTIQTEAIRQLAQGFDTYDYSGEMHRNTMQHLVRSIATGSDSTVKIAGIQELGSYANRGIESTGSSGKQNSQVQIEACEAITAICSDDKDIAVKQTGLGEVVKRLDMLDYQGTVHAEAVDAIRRIATSVTIKDEADPKTVELVHTAINTLGSYANRKLESTGTQAKQHPQVQETARAVIHLITSTMGVEKFEDLKP